MPIIYCPYCDEEHDVLLLIKDISELYGKYLVTYVDTSYYCEKCNEEFEDGEMLDIRLKFIRGDLKIMKSIEIINGYIESLTKYKDKIDNIGKGEPDFNIDDHVEDLENLNYQIEEYNVIKDDLNELRRLKVVISTFLQILKKEYGFQIVKEKHRTGNYYMNVICVKNNKTFTNIKYLSDDDSSRLIQINQTFKNLFDIELFSIRK